MLARSKCVLITLVALGLVAGPASATTLDFGPYGTNIGSIGGASGSDIYAQRFVAPSDNVLVEAGMYLAYGGDQAPAVRLDIWGTDGAGWPDENNIVVVGPVYQQNFPDLTLVTLSTSTTLVTGQTYWVVLNGMMDQVSAGNYSSTWSYPDDPYGDGYATWSNDMGATWSTYGMSGGYDWGFRVVTIPEPGALGLLGIGGLMLVGRTRR